MSTSMNKISKYATIHMKETSMLNLSDFAMMVSQILILEHIVLFI